VTATDGRSQSVSDVRRKTLALTAILGLTSTAVLADDALPLFLGLGYDAFTLGVLWVLVAEGAYFFIKFTKTGLFRKMATVIGMNVVSTLVGFLLVGLEADRIAVWLGGGFGGDNFEGLFDHPVHQVLGVLATFAIGYVTSTLIEWFPMLVALSAEEQLTGLATLQHSALCNFISYAGLTLLYVAMVVAHWGGAVNYWH